MSTVISKYHGQYMNQLLAVMYCLRINMYTCAVLVGCRSLIQVIDLLQSSPYANPELAIC